MQRYEQDAYCRELETTLTARGVDEQGRHWAVFADTILYPEGGGQPADRGRAGCVEVLDVQKSAEGPRHYLAGPLAADAVACTLTLDWERRFDLMQQHSAQHLLSAIALDRFGWQTTAFHLQETIGDIEVDATPTPAQLAELEEAVAAAVREARPIRGFRVQPEEMAKLGVRSRGLPAGHVGDVRLVEIEGIDLNTCGGTHLRSTAEIEALKIVATEKMRGGTRLAWVAGGRLRRRLERLETLAADLRRLLSANDDTLTAIAQSRLDQLRDADRVRQNIEGKLAEAWTGLLLARAAAEPVVDLHDDDATPALLQQIARRFVAAPGAGILLATCGGAAGANFLVAAGPAAPTTAALAGQRVAETLGGRGGGNGPIFQGRAPNLDARAAAITRLSTP
jgi:alanyl-tRNA synthetase